MTSAYVGPRDSLPVVVVARTAGERLVWSVHLQDKGLELSVTLKPDDGDTIVLFPPKKIRESVSPSSLGSTARLQ